MGGLDAGYGQFPWTAHIKIRGPNIDKVCGGTLVNMRWIVTAGHCTQYCQDVPHCVGEISQAGKFSQHELNTPSDLFIPKTNYKSDVKKYPTFSSLALCITVLSAYIWLTEPPNHLLFWIIPFMSKASGVVSHFTLTYFYTYFELLSRLRTRRVLHFNYLCTNYILRSALE